MKHRPEGAYKPTPTCDKYVGMGYLNAIRSSKQVMCTGAGGAPSTQITSGIDCFTAPFVRVGNSSKAGISLCRSKNLVLDSCRFFWGKRKGTMSKKFPVPAHGAVRLACDPVNGTAKAEKDKKLFWLNSIHHDVWWANATRDDAGVQDACAEGSKKLVTTPTLFVMRDRHANYAHEMEVVSMAFSFLAAIEPKDVAEKGVQVVIVDQAPPTGFLETWARISHPHRLRILTHEPFPNGTCFRSAYHVYTFAAGIGYNTNGLVTKCESPVLTGLSNWLRQLYDEHDPASRFVTPSPAAAAAAVAGPAAAAARVTGLRPPTGGIVLKNVVWLSRRNLETVRLLLGASEGWKAMRLVRNEDAVAAAVMAAVQEWNAESCLLKRFDRVVKAEYERSFTVVSAVHLAAKPTGEQRLRRLLGTALSAVGLRRWGRALLQDSTTATGTATAAPAATGSSASALASATSSDDDPTEDEDGEDVSDTEYGGGEGASGGEGGEEDYDEDYEDEDELEEEAETGEEAGGAAAVAAPVNVTKVKPAYMISNNIVSLDRLWEMDAADGHSCRRTNVLFKFVDGDFNEMPYHQQLQTIFRTGVLAGVHGAGLTHGFFLPPGQSAVLQLLGESFASVTANNVFRNMAVGVSNFYEDVLYQGVDVDTEQLKQAVKRAMDFVARKSMEAQARRQGALRLVLVDQAHFAVELPPKDTCPREQP
ncbi:hypothetical protein HYH03_004867 [Edaphochlamys debaryana]|uniref:Uncharacterized protein n=1 Tax=Edaphochlamys debaryana TaxID=47281 RepID=A0A835Y756_9CHLO|nr:hypothetical protein HYH03_004867 [Edaphochlamys debaryana]|eukprot:KAG2497283.1 hypothetical protein HYH03_004867 [Edaphochlamys debaryana]